MPVKPLVIIADDMGSSLSVNRAIAEAHDEGILAAASIMAGGAAFDDAVRLLLERDRLSAGLHVTLCDGKAVLPPAQIPDMVDQDGNFIKSPFAAGLRYTRLAAQVEAEVAAQFERVEKAGVRLYHVDGHHHLQLHPLIFEILCRQASQRGIYWIRLPHEPLSIVARYHPLPFIEWAVSGMLRRYNIRTARKYGMRIAAYVYGLSRRGGIDETYLLKLISYIGNLPDTVSELFTHPDAKTLQGRKELSALLSPRVRDLITALDVQPTGYKELTTTCQKTGSGSVCFCSA